MRPRAANAGMQFPEQLAIGAARGENTGAEEGLETQGGADSTATVVSLLTARLCPSL